MNADQTWEDVQESLDVYQLWELLVFSYGADILPDSKNDVESEESEYNPEHLYESIRYEMEQKEIFEDFILNWEIYQIKMQEADPTHWRHRTAQLEKMMNNWGDDENQKD